MKRCSKDALVEFGVRFLTKKGVAEKNARVISEIAVKTQAMGIHTHGLVVFPYFNQNIPDPIDPAAEPTVAKESGATALIEGNFGFAQLALDLAKDLAVKKASKQGVALVTVRKCSWFGALGPYLHSLAEQGYMAQLWAQTTTCRDAAPHGGIDAKFSTNPIALAFPTKGNPVLSDFSTTTISMGNTKRMAQNAEQAPEPIFLDSGGNLSSDPKVALDGGSVLFIGGANYGYKGYGLSLWSEGIAALAGGECNNPETKTSQSASLTVIDPRAFAGHDYFYAEFERFKAHMLNNRVRPGFQTIRLPGERISNSLRESANRGIPVEEGLLKILNDLAEQHGIPSIPAE
ncbi:MAG: Ldh family oxidoreductase [Spirochaetaceae bacterium]|nr:MAG: Ldh family oxidoreductase [Spirochaetaceae bacterium]